MKVRVWLVVMTLGLLWTVCADEELDSALESVFESSPVPLSYWTLDLMVPGYLADNGQLPECFSAYRVSDEGGQRYAIARSALTSGSRYYFWYVPPAARPSYDVETAEGATVTAVVGARRGAKGSDVARAMDRAALLAARYRELERRYSPGLTTLMVGNAALGATCALVVYLLDDLTVNAAVVLFGSLSGLSVGFAIYQGISNPIIRNRMDDVLVELGAVWK